MLDIYIVATHKCGSILR